MAYEHIPYGVVLDENAAIETLRPFPVVLLPNVSILSDAEVALLRRYVEEGGRLLITGLTGTHDRMGNLQTNSSLESLIGGSFRGRLDRTDNWVRFSSDQSSSLSAQIAPAGRVNWPFLVRGPAAVYRATTATPIGELLKPHHTKLHEEGRYSEDSPLSADTPVGPAILLNQVGKGRVLALGASPDWATASDHHIVEARRLIRNAVRLLNPKPRVEISAPANVEAVVTDDPAARTLRVHLLGYNSPPQTTPAKNRPYILPGLIEDEPIYRASIALDRPIKQAAALGRSSELKRRGSRLDALVSGVHEVIILRY
jgi:hypothetical protein